MRPLGPTEGPFLVPSAGSGDPLRAGALVSLRVLREEGGGLYRVLLGGRELLARSSAALLPGSLHRARAERPAGGGPGLLLRLLPAPGERAASLLSSLGVPADSAARLALSALLAEGLRPEPGALARARRAILGARPGREEAVAELAAALEAKGLGSAPEALEALAGLAEGGGEGPGGEGGPAPERREPGGPGGRGAEAGEGEGGPAESGAAEAGGASEAGPGWREAAPAARLEAEELVPALAALIRSLLLRSAPPERPGAALLGLFNHARGREASSLLLPFRFSLDSVEFAGSFLVHLAQIPGGPCRLSARFSVESGGAAEEWRLDLESGGEGSSLLRLEAGRPLPPAALERLEAELAASACTLRIGREDGPRGGGEIDLDA